MIKITLFIRSGLLLSLILALVLSLVMAKSSSVKTITWEELIPPEYSPEKLFLKYGDKLNKVEDGTQEAMELYTMIMEELNNAPVNTKIKFKNVRISGFIAPLKIKDQVITEFLLVPYFGQCVHVPPPPVNQTILVQTAKDEGIHTADIYDPFWVEGKLSIERHETDLAMAGYKISKAKVRSYDE